MSDKLSIGRIVHPTDFEVSGESAFAHALKLGLAAQSQFRIVHVDSDRSRPGPEWRSFPGVRRTLSRWGLLEEGAPERAVGETLGLYVTKNDLGGAAPAKTLVRFLEEHPADLIVLGVHAREGLERLFEPSVSEPVARRARIPALFVPVEGRGFVDRDTGTTHLRNVLIPVDRSPDATAAIDMAIKLSELTKEDTRFHLLHVGGGEGPPHGHAGDPRFHAVARDGPVVDAIVDAAHQIGADLIVMATQGHDGFLDVFRGSTTEQVLRRAGRALLAVPA